LAFFDKCVTSGNDLKAALDDKCVQRGDGTEGFLNLLPTIGCSGLCFTVCFEPAINICDPPAQEL
jgi:hypothetical protein